MAWIKQRDEADWSGDLEPLRDEVTDPTYGRVDNIMAIHSLDAGSLAAHLGLYRQAMAGTKTLRKVERELVALVVSQINECEY